MDSLWVFGLILPPAFPSWYICGKQGEWKRLCPVSAQKQATGHLAAEAAPFLWPCLQILLHSPPMLSCTTVSSNCCSSQLDRTTADQTFLVHSSLPALAAGKKSRLPKKLNMQWGADLTNFDTLPTHSRVSWCKIILLKCSGHIDIWVSFCRTGKMIKLCLKKIFFAASLWPNGSTFLNCSEEILSVAS